MLLRAALVKRLVHSKGEHKMPKRAREQVVSNSSSSSSASSSATDISNQNDAARSKRKAATDAAAKIKESVAEEAAPLPGTRGGGGDAKQNVVTVLVVPGSVPGYTPDKSLYVKPVPKRDADGFLVFKDHPEFTPNLTPAEVLQAGAFGGGYFRTIKSGVTGKTYVDAWKEFPAEWFAGLNIKQQVASPNYDPSVNKFGVKCGQGLLEWEASGWIAAQDPFGWFHWYCRFYLGRRSEDDARQISRWVGIAGPKGR